MEVHSQYDPAPNGYEEWWNEFPMEPELIYLSQIPFDSLMASSDSCAYQSDQLSQDELEQDDSYYMSSKESPSSIGDSAPVTPEPQSLQGDAQDLQIVRKEFQAEAEEYDEKNVLIPTKNLYEVQTHPNDLVLVLTRQFNHASAAGTEFKLMPVSSATETYVSTLDEATKQEIKNRLAQRKPITKPQPFPDEVLHQELTRILHEHNILQKSLARTLGIRYEDIYHGLILLRLRAKFPHTTFRPPKRALLYQIWIQLSNYIALAKARSARTSIRSPRSMAGSPSNDNSSVGKQNFWPKSTRSAAARIQLFKSM